MSQKISEGIGLNDKRADQIIDEVREMFASHTLTEDKMILEFNKKYKTNVEKLWAGYVLGMVKGEKCAKREDHHMVHEAIADLLVSFKFRKSSMFIASLGAFAFMFCLIGGTLGLVDLISHFNWLRLIGVIFNFVFAALIFWVHAKN